ncbi:TonB-dependent receptor [Flavivirga aquimarina]|uniref:TonB-dependent receptor n=1 Tax=Flavivirga aquimarina TaxID=2027862 RepID=A0ABT8W561_9FLAO|nr:TonB-dependent receptor plug domain-containing protein [Flavivirga aquimarina]MDO5968238.1 TonB-dependent receptor [Flavivirga aquimarina]
MKFNTFCIPSKGILIPIFLLCFNVYTLFAQTSILDKEIAITFEKETLADALTKLERMANCSFSYAPNALSDNRKISKDYSETTLREILNELLVAYQIYYAVRGNTILIQTDTKKGQVTGKTGTFNGDVLPFVSVVLKGTSFGASSDEEGNYSFYAPEGEYIIVSSSIGFGVVEKDITITKNNITIIDFELAQTSENLDEVIVTESRIPENISEVPSTVIIISGKTLNQQAAIDDNLPDILSLTVPGLSPSEESQNAFSTKLRGRDPLMLIDGIPQTSPLRDGSRDLRTISTGILERIEVINGATATYGNGATGGVINYITQQPLKQNGKKFSMDVNGNFNLANTDDTFGYSISPTFFSKTNGLDIILSARYKKTGVLRSADSEVISPLYGLGETQSSNIFGKIGYTIAKDHRIEFMGNSFYSRQDSKYINENGVFGEKPAIGILGDSDIRGGTPKNINLYLKYSGTNVFLNTDINANWYYNGSENIFEGYNKILATNQGLRFNFKTDIPVNQSSHLSFLYGLDLLEDFTVQENLDGSLVTPEIDLKSIAPFAQAKLVLGSGIVLKGGIRYENMQVDISELLFEGNIIDKNSFDDNALVFNAGLKYNKLKTFQPFVSFSQGFTIGDIGLDLRNGLSVNDFIVEPGITNNYELGFMGKTGILKYEVAGYYSTSEKGVRFVETSPQVYESRIQPQNIYGIEAILSAPITEKISLMASVGYVDGEEDSDNDGEFESKLYNAIVPPLKLTGTLNYRFSAKWNALLQIFHVGSRDVFSTDDIGKYGKNPITGYTLVDLFSSYRLDNITFKLGVDNLFNADYFPVNSEIRGSGPYYQKGSGMTLNLGFVLSI